MTDYLKNLMNSMEKDIETVPKVPMDSSVFSFGQYMKAISSDFGTQEFYRRYLNHLQYFMGIYWIKGDKAMERLAPTILRHAIEFGRVALTRLNGKLVPLAIVKLELDIYGEPTVIEGMPIRPNYNYSKDNRRIKCKPEETVILYHNYLALPMLYFWREPIINIIRLLKAAINGSIASIKKFKRNINNNVTDIHNIENLSYLDSNPYIVNISSPMGYYGLTKKDRNTVADIDSNRYDRINTTTPSNVEFSTVNPDTSHLWNNLKEYMEFEYYQLNRRLNTNKKSERNIAAEIQTETINFDLLDQEFKRYLLVFMEDCKEKLGIDIEIVDYIKDSMSPEMYDNTKLGGDPYGKEENNSIEDRKQ